MQSDRALNFTASPEETAERELNLGSVAADGAALLVLVQTGFHIGHAREDLGGPIDAVVDEVIETDVVIAREANRTCDSTAPADVPGDGTDGDESEPQQKRRQVDHDFVY